MASNEVVRARVLSLLGRELIPLQNSNILDLENLNAGIYLLEVSTNETKQVLRFVKE
ncbi:MAG: T9SS type A sorting domain-containing protein [Bacteroidetes bacterium]|nr:T9SS type A sorting domain-containing protein [Bacteroidota bacterium]